jgi:hypothetical protein
MPQYSPPILLQRLVHLSALNQGGPYVRTIIGGIGLKPQGFTQFAQSFIELASRH